MKKHLFLFFFCVIILVSSQDYIRSWGTYYGGTQTRNMLFSQVNGKIDIDNISNQLIDNTWSSTYYNQFITTGMQLFIPGSANNYHVKFNTSGNIISASYDGIHSTTTDFSYVVHRDKYGNFYRIEQNLSQINNSTPLTWFTDNNNGQYKILLAKYNASGGLIWRTYLPSKDWHAILTTDDYGNVYISNTTYNQNIADSNAFIQNFVVSYDNQGLLQPNHYLVKLDSSGQKIWATYYFTCEKIVYNNDNIYTLSIEESNLQTATQGTFQQAPGSSSIQKMNAITGQRIWGTNYCPNAFSNIKDIEVKNSSIYGVGMSYNFGNPGSYFATNGAFLNTMLGQQNMFIVKFDDTGNRVWGTYFGGDNYEEGYSISVKNNKLLISGYSNSSNIATEGAFINLKPNPGKMDLFFSMFTTNGEHLFTSYYGANDPNSEYIVNSNTTYAIFSDVEDAFYFGGSTFYHNGFTTTGAWQPNFIYPSTNQITGEIGFISKFIPKFLNTNEQKFTNDLILFNNPNDGDFYIKGNVLLKEKCFIKIYDVSGKLVYESNLKQNEKNKLYLKKIILTGSYIVKINNDINQILKTFKMIVK